MKKIALFLLTIATLALHSCGVGVYTVNSGMADEASVCFVDTKNYKINVNIDGKSYDTKTIKQKPYKARRNIKKTAKRQIAIAPGRHKVRVTRDGQEVYMKEIYVSANEVKVIEL